MTLFDWLNQILLHKKKWEDFSETEQKTFNTFMINRFLSMSKDFVDAVNICQEHTFQMEDKDVYNLYKSIKSLSQREITDYMPMIKKEHIEYLGKHYGKNKKQIKEMMK